MEPLGSNSNLPPMSPISQPDGNSLNPKAEVSVSSSSNDPLSPKELSIEPSIQFVSSSSDSKSGRRADLSYPRLASREGELNLFQKMYQGLRTFIFNVIGKKKLPEVRDHLLDYSTSANNSLFRNRISYHATLCFESGKENTYMTAVKIQKEINLHHIAEDNYGKPFVLNLYNMSEDKDFSILVNGSSYCLFTTNTEPNCEWLQEFHGVVDKMLRKNNESMQGTVLTYYSPESDKPSGKYVIQNSKKEIIKSNDMANTDRSTIAVPKNNGYFGVALHDYLSTRFGKNEMKNCSATDLVDRFVRDLEGLSNLEYHDHMREIGRKVLGQDIAVPTQ